MAEEIKAFLEEYNKYFEQARGLSPGGPSSFGGMFKALMKEGALSAKVKELIAVGIAVETRCKPCIILHVQKCLQAGATPQEIMESAGVAIMMRGGPAFTQLPLVAQAIEEFTA